MRFLHLAEVVELHRLLVETTGGSPGIRGLGALESALAQPRMSFLNGFEIQASVEEQESLIPRLGCRHARAHRAA